MFLFTIKNGYRFVQAWVKNPIYVECFGNQFRRSIEFMNAGAKRARVKPSNFESRMVDIYHPCLERGMVLLLDLPYYIYINKVGVLFPGASDWQLWMCFQHTN